MYAVFWLVHVVETGKMLSLCITDTIYTNQSKCPLYRGTLYTEIKLYTQRSYLGKQ